MSMNTLRGLVANGYTIVWVGIQGTLMHYGCGRDPLDLAVEVRLTNAAGERGWRTVDVRNLLWADAVLSQGSLRLESDQPGSKLGTVWSLTNSLDLLRLAAINGLTVCSEPIVGRSQYRPMPNGVCTMGYDLEICPNESLHPGLPLPCDKVLVGCLWCSCGYRRSFHTRGLSAASEPCRDSADLLQTMINAIEAHCPIWLVGHNCYAFDNLFFAYHLPTEERERRILPVRLGKTFGSSLSCVLSIRGVNNVDLYAYMDATLRSEYQSLSLASLADALGLAPKLHMPSLNVGDLDNIDSLCTYCTRDCMLAALIFERLDIQERLSSMACASRSPVIDVVKYSTGIMAACTLSSYSLSAGRLMDWSVHSARLEFEGGFVMAPKAGLYANVRVLDFSSMYPTLMLHSNISPDRISLAPRPTGTSNGSVSWSLRGVTTCLSDRLCTFSRAPGALVPMTVSTLLDWRNKYRRTLPTFATSIKVATNSIFGALGFSGSPVYSPCTSASTTLIARWCLSLTFGIIASRGFEVIYGDTDSCFIAATGGLAGYRGSFERREAAIQRGIEEVQTLVTVLSTYVPILTGLVLSSDSYDTLLLVDKKAYCYSKGSTITPKGLSVVRKDRPPYIKQACTTVLHALASIASASVEQTEHATRVEGQAQPMGSKVVLLSRHIRAIRQLEREWLLEISSGKLAISDVASTVREGGHTWLRYRGVRGVLETVSAEVEYSSSAIGYDRASIISSLHSNIELLLAAALP